MILKTLAEMKEESALVRQHLDRQDLLFEMILSKLPPHLHHRTLTLGFLSALLCYFCLNVFVFVLQTFVLLCLLEFGINKIMLFPYFILSMSF